LSGVCEDGVEAEWVDLPPSNAQSIDKNQWAMIGLEIFGWIPLGSLTPETVATAGTSSRS
jgi:hypothetical protein